MTSPDVSPSAAGAPVVLTAAQYRQWVRQNPEQALVDLSGFIPGLRLDIRYATAHNLLGVPLYARAAAYLRRPAAQALREAQRELAGHGLGLLVFDAYRPYRATVRMWNHVQNETYTAPPWRGSRHNRGCSVDAALVTLATGRPVPAPTDFDDFTPAAHADFEPVPAAVRHYRTLLLTVLARHGFGNYAGEWWHFDFHRWAEFDLLDLDFAELS
ncbi:M15 family metallopeptidase [Hymenobacter persicinus]|uniref:D-alanyl-D-alanine dipeptidase n=1 Tax=Hymenobacter persicinus TaxID=2025506 RepID=A0A4Q5LAR5_9BACT|nr:M15 family metallopeptidase [Hymenobacter persicinus]RYU79132.1 D-alanyl-D-alanine dipeptidase [Hymenobacter persicinus]